jgi:hypothetical protein
MAEGGWGARECVRTIEAAEFQLGYGSLPALLARTRERKKRGMRGSSLMIRSHIVATFRIRSKEPALFNTPAPPPRLRSDKLVRIKRNTGHKNHCRKQTRQKGGVEPIE